MPYGVFCFFVCFVFCFVHLFRVCACTGTHISTTKPHQRTTWRSQFFPSTMRVPGIIPRSSNVAASSLYTVPTKPFLLDFSLPCSTSYSTTLDVLLISPCLSFYICESWTKIAPTSVVLQRANKWKQLLWFEYIPQSSCVKNLVSSATVRDGAFELWLGWEDHNLGLC